jgi:hypothetical protein
MTSECGSQFLICQYHRLSRFWRPSWKVTKPLHESEIVCDLAVIETSWCVVIKISNMARQPITSLTCRSLVTFSKWQCVYPVWGERIAWRNWKWLEKRLPYRNYTFAAIINNSGRGLVTFQNGCLNRERSIFRSQFNFISDKICNCLFDKVERSDKKIFELLFDYLG